MSTTIDTSLLIVNAENIVQRIYQIIHRFLCCNPVTIPVLVCRPDGAFAVPHEKLTRPPPLKKKNPKRTLCQSIAEVGYLVKCCSNAHSWCHRSIFHAYAPRAYR